MDRQYDLFEKMPDGCRLWRTSVSGREAALRKLNELAKKSANSFIAMHLPTREIIGTSEQEKRAGGASA
jgi:hypothetical protein